MYKLLLICLGGILWHSPAFADCATELAPGRNPSWATPVSLAGVPNLYRVAPNFYRSAQPDQEGFEALVRRCRVRTVISLRAFHSDEPLVKDLGVRLFDFPMHTWHIEPEDVVGALKQLVQSMRSGPTLLHCEHGADRTGLVTALYRLAYQDWSKEAAINELENGNYGFHDVWINIPAYVRETNVAALKHELASH
jgi:protein tyrosine/serine phosphatase